MAHVELPKEELQPLLESIQEAFEPLTKAMPPSRSGFTDFGPDPEFF